MSRTSQTSSFVVDKEAIGKTGRRSRTWHCLAITLPAARGLRFHVPLPMAPLRCATCVFGISAIPQKWLLRTVHLGLLLANPRSWVHYGRRHHLHIIYTYMYTFLRAIV